MLREAKAGDYELYAAADGVIKVTSGVERRILHALQDGDFTPTELSYVIGRSRSTLSEYLNTLERDGLIASVTKDEDGRSKVYTLLSDPLVNSKRPDRRHLLLCAPHSGSHELSLVALVVVVVSASLWCHRL